MTEAYAIKPCPFCGGKAEIIRQGTTRQSMQIACTNCNTQVESGDVMGLTPPDKWHWNKRHPVTVSEKGEADKDAMRYAALKKMLPELMAICAQAGNNTSEAMDILFNADTSKIDEFLDAYLSRGHG